MSLVQRQLSRQKSAGAAAESLRESLVSLSEKLEAMRAQPSLQRHQQQQAEELKEQTAQLRRGLLCLNMLELATSASDALEQAAASVRIKASNTPVETDQASGLRAVRDQFQKRAAAIAQNVSGISEGPYATMLRQQQQWLESVVKVLSQAIDFLANGKGAADQLLAALNKALDDAQTRVTHNEIKHAEVMASLQALAVRAERQATAAHQRWNLVKESMLRSQPAAVDIAMRVLQSAHETVGDVEGGSQEAPASAEAANTAGLPPWVVPAVAVAAMAVVAFLATQRKEGGITA